MLLLSKSDIKDIVGFGGVDARINKEEKRIDLIVNVYMSYGTYEYSIGRIYNRSGLYCLGVDKKGNRKEYKTTRGLINLLSREYPACISKIYIDNMLSELMKLEAEENKEIIEEVEKMEKMTKEIKVINIFNEEVIIEPIPYKIALELVRMGEHMKTLNDLIQAKTINLLNAKKSLDNKELQSLLRAADELEKSEMKIREKYNYYYVGLDNLDIEENI